MADSVENGIPGETLRIEAQEIVKEVAYAVEKVEISDSVPNTDDAILLNIETKERCTYCIELSDRGFRVSECRIFFVV